MKALFLLTSLALALLVSPALAQIDAPFSSVGELQQGGLIRAQSTPGTKVTIDGRNIELDSEGRFIFGFDRDHKSAASVEITRADGSAWSGVLDIAPREYDIQYVEGIAKKYIEPAPETLARIRAEAKRKRAARARNEISSGFLADFVWPLTGRISGVYGSQRFYNGNPGRPHFGVDVAAPTGTLFHSPAAGVVTLADDDMYYEGGLIFLDHGHGLTSAFLHLSGVDVKPGDIIAKGDLLGRVGAGGRANGPHLDWRMYWFDQHIDPVLVVGPMPQ